MIEALWTVAVVAHLALLGTWLGSMAYSLLIVQPRAARFFASDDEAHEAFLVTLGAGNRRPVLALLGAIAASGVLAVALSDPGTVVSALYAVEGLALIAAATIFARVSWRLWPQRVFALPAERPAHQRRLRRHAAAMVVLAALAFACHGVATTLTV
jgi:hypothetical protein